MIIGIVGLPGYGKTLMAARLCYQRAERSKRSSRNRPILLPDGSHMARPIVSNIPMMGAYQLDYDTFRTAMLPQNAIVLLDEVQWWASARNWQKLDAGVYVYFSQARKLALDLIWTAQSAHRVDVTLRECTELFYHVEPLFWRYRQLDMYGEESDLNAKANPIQSKTTYTNPRLFDEYDSYAMVTTGQAGGVHLNKETDWTPWPWTPPEKQPTLLQRMKDRLHSHHKAKGAS